MLLKNQTCIPIDIVFSGVTETDMRNTSCPYFEKFPAIIVSGYVPLMVFTLSTPNDTLFR